MSASFSTTDPTRTSLPPTVEPQPPAPKRKVRRRSAFWPGFAVGFSLLALASCGGLAASFGFTRLSLADIQGNAPAWVPPAITATPLPVAANAAPAALGRFTLGQQVRNLTNSRVNIGSTPGHLSKPAGDILAQVEPNATLEIIGPSSAANNLTWWQVRYVSPDGIPLEGWMAEATASGVQILGQ
ncbi:MAG: hypothetical protein IPK16_33535 [Anaerolineales bacterium]|nr:hypothetical protein [Anaerolineales bacterium]